MAKASQNTTSSPATPAGKTTKKGFQKGMAKVAGSGRKKGVQNKSTTEFRKIFSDILQSEIDKGHIVLALEDLRTESPKDYLDKLIKIAQFNLPQLQAVEFNGQVEQKDPFKEHMAQMAGFSTDLDQTNKPK